MLLDAAQLASVISTETRLPFEHTSGTDDEGRQWIDLTPSEADRNHTFSVRFVVGWRRLELQFGPGKFAGQLLSDMSAADPDGRSRFTTVLGACENNGAEIHFSLNGENRKYADKTIWNQEWSRLSLALKKGHLEIGDDDAEPDIDIAIRWGAMFCAAILAILPLEYEADEVPDDLSGYPEGAQTTVRVNRYERDRRNRAAAIAIHGTECSCCGMDFAHRYGAIGSGFIEVHHITPVSQLGSDYVINPKTDLVPLCSNCHSMVHRTNPAMTIEALREIIERSTDRDH